LRAVDPGPIDLLCLPIALVGSDGVPARVLVRPRAGVAATPSAS
jgi:kynurenine formamidase